VPIVASGELLPLWPFYDLLGTDPWLVSQWVFAGSGETDGCGMEILFYRTDWRPNWPGFERFPAGVRRQRAAPAAKSGPVLRYLLAGV
jgi:hypothetical protein